MLANTATILTHTPGGLGVIETVVLLVLKRPDLIGAVLLFRFVYFLLPLCLGAAVFAIAELRWRLSSRDSRPTAKSLSPPPWSEERSKAEGPARIDEARAENVVRRTAT